MALTALDIRRTTNLFGPLGHDVRARLEAVIAAPSDETWQDAYSIILNSRTHTTLWQAVIAVDPAFPRSGPLTTPEGRSPWPAVPPVDVLLAALRYAADPPKVTCEMDPGRPGGAGSYHHGPHEVMSACRHPQLVERDD